MESENTKKIFELMCNECIKKSHESRREVEYPDEFLDLLKESYLKGRK